MVATPTKVKVSQQFDGRQIIRAKLPTTTLLGAGEIGYTGSYLKYYTGGVERAIGGNAANALRLDELANPTGSVSLNSQKITSLLAPTADTDAANKAYVDAVASGLDLKSSVKAATTSNLAATLVGLVLTADANGALPTIDGVTLSTGNRVLVKAQTAPEDNGIYEVTAIGDGSNPYVLTRTSDADNSPSGEVTSGMFTFVEQGTVNADSGWALITEDPITLGTTELTFTQFSGAGNIIGGAGLTKTGSTIDVVSANTGITVNADNIELALATNSGLEISSGLKVASTIAGAGIAFAGGVIDVASANTGITVNADNIELALATNSGLEISSGLKVASTIAGAGTTFTDGVVNVIAGTGITVNANDVAINTSVVGRKLVDDTTIIGDDTEVDFTITHNFANKWVIVQVFNTTTERDELVDVQREDANTIIVHFETAPATGEDYAVTIIG